jgi:hypothetical protein
MAYHESLWLAAAAAAPVIALANTVSISDLVSVWFNTKSSLKQRRVRVYYSLYILLSAYNFIAQTFILYQSAMSLTNGKDNVKPTSISFNLAFGLITVLVSVLFNVFVRYTFLDSEKLEKGAGGEKING